MPCYTAAWLLPIDRPPVRRGWIDVADGVIAGIGSGAPPSPAGDLGHAAILPGLVNAHTHLELSWMRDLVPPAASMHEWIRNLLRVRRIGPPGGAKAAARAAKEAAASMAATGTVLVGDVSNTLMSVAALRDAALSGVMFHEVLGFNATDPSGLVRDAWLNVAGAVGPTSAGHVASALIAAVVAHAPYSVSPALFAEIARRAGDAPLSVHLGESPEEIAFLRTGAGPIRAMLEELDVWTDTWDVPACDPVEYLDRVGYLQPGTLAVHCVHLKDDALEKLRSAGAAIVTCPRSNTWVGAGLPRVGAFYASGCPVAIGTDSLASASSLNMFDELAELRRIAPDVSAAALLESATRVGAQVLGYGATHGTLSEGKRAAVISVAIPPHVTDVEEYLVSGVPASAVHRLPY